MNEFKVDTYPVGILRQLLRIKVALNPRSLHDWGHPEGGLWHPGWRRGTVRHALQTIREDCKRRSAWNGYLAEPTTDGIYWYRCGHGWTKRRAMASLVRHIGEVQRDGYLRMGSEVSA